MDTLARLAPRLAVGLAIALALGAGFAPLVIREYASGGSLAAVAAPWTIVAASIVANAVVVGGAALALRGEGRGEDGPESR